MKTQRSEGHWGLASVGWGVTEDQLEGPSFQAATTAGEKAGQGVELRVGTQEFTDLDSQSIQSTESLEQHLALGGVGKGPRPLAKNYKVHPNTGQSASRIQLIAFVSKVDSVSRVFSQVKKEAGDRETVRGLSG